MTIKLSEYDNQSNQWSQTRSFDCDAEKVNSMILDFNKNRKQVDGFYKFEIEDRETILTVNPFLFD